MEPVGVDTLLKQKRIFSLLASLCSVLYLHAPEGWYKNSEDPPEFCVRTLVSLPYFSLQLLWDSG